MVIFSKILSDTDIKRRCAVPMKYFKMEGFPRPRPSLEGNHQEDFVVKDESGQDWILCCSIRNIGDDSNRPKHPKPVLIKEWIPFVRNKKLSAGDTVIIYETSSMQRMIKVEKRTSSYEAHWPPMNQNLDGNKGSTSHNSANESTATLQPSEDHSKDVLNHALGGTTATTPSIDKKHIPTTHSTSQNMASYKTKRPRQSLSLELILKPATTGGTTAATRSNIDKKQTPIFHSSSQDIGRYNTDTPSLSLDLGLTLKPTIKGGQQHAYIQETEPKTIDFLGRFL